MRKIAKITGLDCANCAVKLEAALAKIKGVQSVSLNFMAQRVTFELDDALVLETIDQIKKITKKMEPDCDYKGI